MLFRFKTNHLKFFNIEFNFLNLKKLSGNKPNRQPSSSGTKFNLTDWISSKGCHRCVVIYEKHKNVLQYKESECEDMYADQLANPAAMPMRAIIKSDHNRGVAHPNSNGHSRLSSSDQFMLRSNDDTDDCKQILSILIITYNIGKYKYIYCIYTIFLLLILFLRK